MNINLFFNNPWEKIFQKGTPEDLEKPAPSFISTLPFIESFPKGKILDIACGAGRHAIYLAEKGYEVNGFDISETALSILSKNAKNKNLSIKTKIGNMYEKFDFPDLSFDGAIAIQAIYHGYPQDMSFCVNEIARVLKPEAFFCFTVSTEIKRSMLGASNIKFKEIAKKVYLPLSGREEGLVHYYPNRDDINNMLLLNFKDVKIQEDNINKYFIITCKKR